MNNGYKVKLGLTVGILFFSVAAGYTEVKIRSINNEKDHLEYKRETNESIKEIREDQKKTLIQMTRALTILEELRNN